MGNQARGTGGVPNRYHISHDALASDQSGTAFRVISKWNTVRRTVPQSAATREISALIQNVSSSAGQISSNITELDQGVAQTSNQAKELQTLFASLQSKTEKLDDDASDFIMLLQAT